MFKHLKIALALLALATFSTESYANEAAAEATVVELKSGAKVEVSGDSVNVINADGTKTPAPDGEHEAVDGSKITTKDGKIVK